MFDSCLTHIMAHTILETYVECGHTSNFWLPVCIKYIFTKVLCQTYGTPVIELMRRKIFPLRFRRRSFHKTMVALYAICSSYISNGANIFLHYNIRDYILSSSWIWYPSYQNVTEIKFRPIYKVQQQVRP